MDPITFGEKLVDSMEGKTHKKNHYQEDSIVFREILTMYSCSFVFIISKQYSAILVHLAYPCIQLSSRYT